MKTLDEVITAMENLTTCDDTGFSYIAHDDAVDALFYLTVFRVERKHLDELHREMVKENDNNPLTWDELKQMEGKPVWIEPVKEWMLLTEVDEEDCGIWLLSLDGLDYDLMLHENWQAYRKERDNGLVQ